jgi:hypothetical protein
MKILSLLAFAVIATAANLAHANNGPFQEDRNPNESCETYEEGCSRPSLPDYYEPERPNYPDNPDDPHMPGEDF